MRPWIKSALRGPLMAAIVWALVAPVAIAAPIFTSATVSLTSPDLITFGFSVTGTLSDTVTVVPGIEIQPCDDTNIGGSSAGCVTPLLDQEYVDLAPSSITVSLQNGSQTTNQTGYSAGSYYEFTNFVWDVPATIVGLQVFLNNISGVTVGTEATFTSNSVRLLIDTLGIDTAPGNNQSGTVLLQLEARPDNGGGTPTVPEPESLPLLAIGVAALVFARRVSSRR
ncbi:MAG TPA: PEP-CTERM sorting domain-containing protein [Burkholderiales bacterium]|nr:PEP-CTERM sorting domain-containing protein [Burkholderiales bacterium]